MPGTTPTDPVEATDNDNWEKRYRGLQRVLSERNRELAAATTAREQLQARFDTQAADMADYAAYKQERDAAAAEQAQREQYEALREQFEQEPPQPQNPNESNRLGWDDRYPRKADEQRTRAGWPT